MSAPQDATQVVTERQFTRAFMLVLRGAFKLALEEGDWSLYVAVTSRDDITMFGIIEAMDLKATQDFVRKALAQQKAQGRGEPDDELFEAAREAADISAELADLCEDIATVKHYCDRKGIETTAFSTQEIMRRIAADNSRS